MKSSVHNFKKQVHWILLNWLLHETGFGKCLAGSHCSAEAKVGKARAGKLEENSDMPILCSPARQPQQQTRGIPSWPTQRHGHGASVMRTPGLLRARLHAFTRPAAKQAHCDAHVQRYARAQPLHNHAFTKRGVRVRGRRPRERDHRHLAQLLFPYREAVERTETQLLFLLLTSGKIIYFCVTVIRIILIIFSNYALYGYYGT